MVINAQGALDVLKELFDFIDTIDADDSVEGYELLNIVKGLSRVRDGSDAGMLCGNPMLIFEFTSGAEVQTQFVLSKRADAEFDNEGDQRWRS